MKRFKFRFEKILDYRRHLEKQKQREFATAQIMEKEQRQKIDEIVSERNRFQSEEKGCLVGNVQPSRLVGYSRYFLLLKHMELTSRERLGEILKEVEKKRAALIEATKRKRIYEKLEDRYKNKYTFEYNRLMQKETDDIGQKIYWHNK